MTEFSDEVRAPKFVGNGSNITVDDTSLAEIKIAVECLLHNRLVAGTVRSDGIKTAGEGFQVKKIKNK